MMKTGHDEVGELRRLLAERDTQIACQADCIAALLASTSWRVTRPLRAVREATRKLSARLAAWSGWKEDYGRWCRRYDTRDTAARKRMRARAESLGRRPVISVLLPVFDPPPRLLDEAIRSVRAQIYPDWELCIADDASTNPAVREVIRKHAEAEPRIKTVQRAKNGHISRATNSALELATGEFIALLDHDDLLPDHALFCVAEAINLHPEAALIYSDEDKINSRGRRFDPYFKSGFNYELLLAQNMVSHLGVYRRDLVVSLGGFRAGFEGSQDWDLALRVVEAAGGASVVHIPRVLYHWRTTRGSTALDVSEKDYAVDAGRRAVQEHLQRRGIAAETGPAPGLANMHRVRYALPDPPPLVSIIIPTRNRMDVLRRCLESVTTKSTYPHYEILVVDNGSDDPAALAYMNQIDDGRISVLRADGPFNFSALNNTAATQARGDVLCLLNNDTEVVTPAWLEEMVSVAIQPGVGAVGARLWYPGGGLQHGGVILGLGGVADHANHNLRRGNPGYFGRAVLRQEFSAVTAACLVVKRSLYLEHGGLDESLAVTCNDVDFCLRLHDAGCRNVWTPYAELIHHESLSRGTDDTPEKFARSTIEQAFMKRRWAKLLADDPCYSPNLSLKRPDFCLAWPPRTRAKP